MQIVQITIVICKFSVCIRYCSIIYYNIRQQNTKIIQLDKIKRYSRQQMEQQLIQSGGKTRLPVIKFALCYLVCTISYSAITTMMYSFYNRLDLSRLALINSIVAFIGFGPTNMVVLHIIRKFNLKKALFFGFIGVFCFDVNIMLTIFALNQEIPILSSLPVLYLMNILTSFMAGMCNSIIWTVMPTYIQHQSDKLQQQSSDTTQYWQASNPNLPQHKNSITAMVGLFWSIQMWSSIIGSLINIFVLGYMNSYVYMIVMLIISGLGIFMVWLFVQPVQVKRLQYDIESVTFYDGVKQQLINLYRLLRRQNHQSEEGFPNIFIYNALSGFFLNFYPIFINKLIQKSLPLDTSQKDFNRLTAIVFIFQGVGCMLTGVFQSRFYYLVSQNKQRALIWGFSFILMTMMITVYCYNIFDHTGEGYWLCSLIIFAWACTDIHIKTNAEAYVRQYNGGKVQYYSLNILFYSIGSILNYVVQMIDNGNYQLIFLLYVGTIAFCTWLLRQPDIGILNKKVGNQLIELRIIERVKEQFRKQ